MKDLIIVKQLPIIEENLKKLSKEIDEKVANAVNLICTQDTIKDVKELRANLNKEYKELESQRKVVKEEVLKPYNDFEDIYKECVSEKYKNADNVLKEKIDSVESELKREKGIEVAEYFVEYGKSLGLDWLVDNGNYYSLANINVTLSASMKSLKESVKNFIDKVAKDINLIETQEYKEEVIYEYKKDLDVSRAITEVKNRHDEIEKAKQNTETKKEQQLTDEAMLAKIENLSAPKVVDNEIYELTFKVRGTKEKLKELKEFLVNGGYEYYE